MTALKANELRDYLVGAWTLESFESSDLDGSDVRYPLGADARGIIMYTPDGYMSAQIMRADRPQFEVGDLSKGDKDELAAAASGYLAYSGPYTVSDDSVVAHHVDVSLLPNWVGGTQYRAARVGDSQLILSPTEPTMLGGQRRNGRLVWRRAQAAA
jgi:Lipocalin-like domain